jgi:hypothetical protein
MATVKAKPAAARPNRRRHHSPETRAKMSAAHKGRIPSAETRAKLAAASPAETKTEGDGE